MTEDGFLTDTDKEFLKMQSRGEQKYDSNQARYDRRRAIRERTRAALRDFTILYETLDEEKRKKIFGISDDPLDVEGGISTETRGGITDALAFLYLSLEGEVGESASRRTQPGVPSFKGVLEKAVSKAERDRHPDEDVPGPYISTELEVKVISDIDVSAAAEKLARGDVWSLSEAELRALAQTAVANVDDFALEPLIEEKRKEMGMDPEEIRAEIEEWFTETYVTHEDAPMDSEETEGGDE